MNRQLDFLLGVPLVWLLGFFSKKKEGVKEDPKKILLIKLAAVGDAILLVPVVRSLQKALPDTQIDLLASSVNYGIAATIPEVRRLWLLKDFSLSSLLKLLRHLRGEKYDVVVDLEQWARGTAILSFFSGALVRMGFDTPGQRRSALYSQTHTKTFEDHEIYDFYNLLGLLKPLERDSRLSLQTTEVGEQELRDVCPGLAKNSKKHKVVLVHPGCGKDGLPREWPLPQYALLVHWIMKHMKAEVIISGGPDEIKKTQDLWKLVNKQAMNVGGRLSWQGMISLVKRVDMVVSGNTGVMHMAAAFQKKQVILQGPTDATIWGPLNEEARVIQSPCPKCPCLKLGFEYHRFDQKCMELIELKEVKEAVSSLFDKKGEI